MPIVAPDSFYTSLRHNKIATTYLLFGEEEFLIDEALTALLEQTVDETTRSFNFDMFYGSEASADQIVARASAYPLMADRRVVVIKEIDRLFAQRSSSESISVLTRYIAQPSPTTVMIATAETGDVLPKGKAAAKGPYAALLEHASCVQFKKIYDREIASWIAGRIKARGRDISAEAIEVFVNYAGSSLRTIHNETEKLFTFVQDRKRITADDVRSVVGVSKTYNIFELQRAIGARSLERSVHIAEQMIRAGESEQMILSMTARYFTILWRLSEARVRTRDQNEIARSVGVSPFFLNDYLAALANYAPNELARTFEKLLQADITLKTSSSPSHIVLQTMLTEIVARNTVT